MQILLVRHGQTSANVLGLLDTLPPGPHLTDLGREQAATLALALDGSEVTSIHASPLLRTQETAAPLAQRRGLPVAIHGGLREIPAGHAENLGDPRSIAAYLETMKAWSDGDLSHRMPGAGTGHEFFGEFDAAVAAIVSVGEGTHVVFSHGGTMRVWAASRCENIPGSWCMERTVHNTGNVLIQRTPSGAWHLIEWNEQAKGGRTVDDGYAPDPTGDAKR